MSLILANISAAFLAGPSKKNSVFELAVDVLFSYGFEIKCAILDPKNSIFFGYGGIYSFYSSLYSVSFLFIN